MGATCQDFPLTGSFERLGVVIDRSGDKRSLARMANSHPAGPLNRHITGFREFKKAINPKEILRLCRRTPEV
jgi:hypothetical protein